MKTPQTSQKPQEKIQFSGVFTPAIRKLLYERRRQLGLSYANLGDFLSVNWSTIRKWEIGPTGKCGLHQRPSVEKFLNGEYNSMLAERQTDYYMGHGQKFLPPAVRACIGRIISTNELCGDSSERKAKLLEEINAKTTEILTRLVEPKPHIKRPHQSQSDLTIRQ